eukprot:9312761-Pyramimonas_sp.AAC.1
MRSVACVEAAASRPKKNYRTHYPGILLSLGTSLQFMQESLSRRFGVALSLETCLQFTQEQRPCV